MYLYIYKYSNLYVYISIQAGFTISEVDNASRSHRVYVARKPELVDAV
jgi:hypothetical protein